MGALGAEDGGLGTLRSECGGGALGVVRTGMGVLGVRGLRLGDPGPGARSYIQQNLKQKPPASTAMSDELPTMPGQEQVALGRDPKLILTCSCV